jgi:hypothetical protein
VSRLTKSLILLGAPFLLAGAAFAQVNYQYTGNPFAYFSCGPNSDNTATMDCFNSPAPGNPLTSYTATDHVTATLTFSAALPVNLNYQDATGFAGFVLTMNDGHQTLSSTSPGIGLIAKVSTDAAGQITGPWLLVINAGNAADSGIASENEPPIQPFVRDGGVLACCDPTIPGNIGENFNAAGTWGGSSQNGLSGGAFTRATEVGVPLVPNSDNTNGGLNTPRSVSGAGSQYGSNVAQAYFKPITLLTPSGPVTENRGPAAGAWSDSNLGDGFGRGLAFSTFNGPPSGPIRVNAVLHGQINHDWFGLPDGNLDASAQILVVRTDKFSALLAGSNQSPSQFLMGTGQASLASFLTNAGAVLATGTAGINASTPFGTFLTIPITTTPFTVTPGAPFTVIFDIYAHSSVGGFIGWSAGTGTVDFVRTLEPADNMFTDTSGNPVAGISGVGDAPATAPVTASINLSAGAPSTLAGTTETLTATVTDTAQHPVTGAVVTFTVTSGPNVGVTGDAATDANGNATFSYIGKGGGGTDVIQASIQTLTSNVVQVNWTIASLSSGSACNGTFNGTFNGNLKVKNGQTCNLLGGRITGNIEQTGGTLTISNYIVGGNIGVSGASSLSTGPSVTINGNVEIGGIPAGTAPSQICGAKIQGNLEVANNGAAVQIGGSTCGGNWIVGNVAVQNNRAATTITGNTVGGNFADQANSGPTQVFNNSVTGNLACQGNSSITGSGNTARSKQGQCAAF